MAEFARCVKGFMVSSVDEHGRKAVIAAIQAFLLVLMIFCVGVVETPAAEKRELSVSCHFKSMLPNPLPIFKLGCRRWSLFEWAKTVLKPFAPRLSIRTQ